MIHQSFGEIKKSTYSKWPKRFAPEYVGKGVVLEGKVTELETHTITDSEDKKFRFVAVVIDVKSARERKFDEKGVEVVPDFHLHSKRMKGHLNIFKDVEADKMELSDQALRRKIPGATMQVGQDFRFLGDPTMVRKVDLVKGDSVRLKSKGDTQFVESIVKLEEDMKGRGNYHGESFLGTLQQMAATNEKGTEEETIERDEAEWASDSE